MSEKNPNRSSIPVILWRLLWVPLTVVGFLMALLGVFMMHGKGEAKSIWRKLW